MLVAIIQNVANIVLSFVLVYVVDMKIEGVAWGTVLAQYIGLISALSLFIPYYLRIKKYYRKKVVLAKPALMKFFSLNKDIFFRTCCLILVHFFFIAAGAKQGDSELAVNTMLMQLFTLYSYIMDGFAFAGEAIAGKAIGANNHRAYTLVVRHLFICGALMIILFTFIYATGSTTFFRLLTNDSGVIALATHYRIWIILIPLCGMAAFIWDGIYIGATATRQMLISMFISLLLFIVLYLLLVPSLGNHGLWIAFLSYLLMRGIVQTVLARELRVKNRLRRSEE
jgi:MATE family multidrug resistance protein